MKTLENTTSQEVKDNSTRELNVKAKNDAKTDTKKVSKKPETKPTVKKEPKVRAESMENLAIRLRKEKADEKTIESAFVKAYKAKGIVEIKFIRPRVAIYLKIADKTIANAK
jgi:hypothetical protein